MRTHQQELGQKLINQIEESFSEMKFEHITLFDDPSWQIQGKHWREIPLDMLKQDGLFWGMPTSKSGQFFLPAYMVALLEHSEIMEGYEEKLLSILAPQTDAQNEAEYLFTGTNNSQKMTVLSFLQAYPMLFPDLFLAKHYPTNVIEQLIELNKKMGLSLKPQTPYEIWEAAVAFWKTQVCSE